MNDLRCDHDQFFSCSWMYRDAAWTWKDTGVLMAALLLAIVLVIVWMAAEDWWRNGRR